MQSNIAVEDFKGTVAFNSSTSDGLHDLHMYTTL